VVERKNIFVHDIARTMFLEAKLPVKFWKEVVAAIVYIINRAQLQANSDNTPYELWKGRPTFVKHFRIFGRKCFMKINDYSLGKFYSRIDA